MCSVCVCVCVCVCSVCVGGWVCMDVSVCVSVLGGGARGEGSDVHDKFVCVNIVYFDVNSSSLIIKYTPPRAHMRKDALGPH